MYLFFLVGLLINTNIYHLVCTIAQRNFVNGKKFNKQPSFYNFPDRFSCSALPHDCAVLQRWLIKKKNTTHKLPSAPDGEE